LPCVQRMPHALHSVLGPTGPLRHWGVLLDPQCAHARPFAWLATTRACVASLHTARSPHVDSTATLSTVLAKVVAWWGPLSAVPPGR
jgi:hypothetical protein